MKRSHFPRAFTLIELLTVIAIIAVLMGLLFPAVTAAMDQTHKLQAKNALMGIITGVRSYYTDYGVYPNDAGSGGSNADWTATGSASGGDGNHRDLMNTLRAADKNNATVKKLNPRLTVYLDIPAAKNPDANKAKNGMADDGSYRDPWGSGYCVSFDANYDNELVNPYGSNAGASPLTTTIIAWSLGKNQKGGTGDKAAGDAKDDVISWQ